MKIFIPVLTVLLYLSYFSYSYDNSLFTVYTVNMFDDVLPSTTNNDGKEIDDEKGVLIWGAKKGQMIIQGSFCVYSTEMSLMNVKVTIESDLKNGNNDKVIEKNEIELLIVKVWKQAGRDRLKETPLIDVPELLVTDDLMDLTGGWTTPTQYDPPVLPDKMVGTTIPLQTSKQFWIKFHPSSEKNLSPGLYKTNLVISSDGNNDILIPFVIDIKDFVLEETNLIHGIYYGTWSLVDNTFPTVVHHALLKDLELRGVNSFKIGANYESKMEDNMDVIKQYPNLIKHSIIWNSDENQGDNVGKVAIAKKYSTNAWFYGKDEPNQGEDIADHIRTSHAYHNVGGKIMVAITDVSDKRYDDPNDSVYDEMYDSTNTFRELGITDEGLDWANYHTTRFTKIDDLGTSQGLYDRTLDYFYGRKEKRKDKIETIYWQFWFQMYKHNRGMSGVYMKLSKLDGLYPYQALSKYMTATGNDPFVDDDGGGVYRDLNLVYPKSNGIISTLQCEAWYEGFVDYRYLYTLETIVKSKPELNQTFYEEWIHKELENFIIPWEYENVKSEFDDLRLKVYNLIEDILLGNGVKNPRNIYLIISITAASLFILITFMIIMIIMVLLMILKKKRNNWKPISSIEINSTDAPTSEIEFEEKSATEL